MGRGERTLPRSAAAKPIPARAMVPGSPAVSETSSRSPFTKLKDQVAERGIKLDYDDLPPGADGVSRGGRSSIRPGLEPANEFSVIVHETRPQASASWHQPPTSQTVREAAAEAVAFVVCQAIGLKTGSAASVHIQLYDGKNETLAASLDRIQHVAADMIAAIQRPNGLAIAA